MKMPNRPATAPTSFASPPCTAPSTARSVGFWRRPSSAMPPSAARTEKSPNARMAHAPKEMGDHPLNMTAGRFADWNSMCQKRRGRPRSIVSSAPETIAPTAATLYPLRATGRSSGPPNQSKTAARKEAPPAIPPTKKYRMMSQVQCGAPLKNVSDIAGSSPALLVHAPFPQAYDGQQSEDGRAGHGEAPALGEVRGRQLRMARQPVDLGGDTLGLELSDAFLGAGPQLGNRPELDRVGGTGLGARRLEAHLEPVVAQGALLGRARHRVDVDHAERARGNAGPAPVAHVGLDHHRVELGADDRAGGAHLQASRLDAVLAHVAHHQPAAVVGSLELLDEAHVPPVDAIQLAGVVVAVAGELPHTAVLGRELVPFLARDLARFAADANRGVGEESHGFGHITPSPRCRRTPCPRG